MLHVRPAVPADRNSLAQMRHDLWPDSTVEEHGVEVEDILAGKPVSILPFAIFVAESDDGLIGFVETGLRSVADGCDMKRPVGYIEGWFVKDSERRRGVGKQLIDAAEDWAREQGCVEVASDTWPENEGSRAAHKALGFEEVGTAILFRKRIPTER